MGKQQEELFSENELLKLRVQSYEHQLEKKEELIVQYQGELEKYKELYLELKRDKFGSKSEKYVNKDQLGFVFNEAEVEALKEVCEEETEVEITQVKAHSKRRGHRKSLPEHLPREIIKLEPTPIWWTRKSVV